MSELIAVSVILLTWLLDRLLGEPNRLHPLVAYGNYAKWLETHLNKPTATRLTSSIALLLALLPSSLALVVGYLAPHALYFILASLALYFTMAHRSLQEHAQAVYQALQDDNLVAARDAVGMMVSRDTQQLTATEISIACIESVLENGNDAIFGVWFWWVIGGIPGILIYRMANTLDAMWGYKHPPYQQFGWAAARFDDLLNFIPARLTALCYCLAGHRITGWRCWQQQARLWSSPNAGPVMTAGAGALQLKLGGQAVYHGQKHQRPPLGLGREQIVAGDILAALHLLRRALWLWVIGLCLLLSCGLIIGEFIM